MNCDGRSEQRDEFWELTQLFITTDEVGAEKDGGRIGSLQCRTRAIPEGGKGGRVEELMVELEEMSNATRAAGLLAAISNLLHLGGKEDVNCGQGSGSLRVDLEALEELQERGEGGEEAWRVSRADVGEHAVELEEHLHGQRDLLDDVLEEQPIGVVGQVLLGLG